MCDLSDGFKLCTCDDELADPDWTLMRLNPSKPQQHWRGMVKTPWFDEDDWAQIHTALIRLNDGSAFDWDYSPLPGDVLILRGIGRHALRFRFDGQWEQDTSNPLEGWRSQMETSATGRTSLAADETAAVLDHLAEDPLDAGRRQVAIDWLREHGHAPLAGWLHMEDLHYHGHDVPGFRAVARKVSRRLRARLTRAPLDGCFRSNCPDEWAALEATSDELQRSCWQCRKVVTFFDLIPSQRCRRAIAPSISSS